MRYALPMGRGYLLIVVSMAVLLDGCSVWGADEGGSKSCATRNGDCPSGANCTDLGDGKVSCVCSPGRHLQNGRCLPIDGPPPPPPTPGPRSTTCADSSTQSQSTCVRGLQCYPVTDSNLCTKQCSVDEDCGTHGSFDNVCLPWTQGISLCFLGCDPADRSTCERADLACQALSEDQTFGACVAACRIDDDCTYGDFCEPDSGLCLHTDCAADDTCADADRVCYVRESDGQTVKSCVPRCSLVGCSSGLECHAATDFCEPVIRGTYESCGRKVGECAVADTCIDFGDPGSLCMTGCTTDVDCAAGSSCAVALSDEQRLCVITCGTAESPDNSVCLPGTTCAWFTDDMRTTLFCGPKPD